MEYENFKKKKITYTDKNLNFRFKTSNKSLYLVEIRNVKTAEFN